MSSLWDEELLEYETRLDLSAWQVLPNVMLSMPENWRPVYTHLVSEGINL